MKCTPDLSGCAKENATQSTRVMSFSPTSSWKTICPRVPKRQLLSHTNSDNRPRTCWPEKLQLASGCSQLKSSIPGTGTDLEKSRIQQRRAGNSLRSAQGGSAGGSIALCTRRSQVRFPVWARVGGIRSMLLFQTPVPLSLALLSCLSKINKHDLGGGLKKK